MLAILVALVALPVAAAATGSAPGDGAAGVTAAGDPTSVHFSAVGDIGATPQSVAVLKGVASAGRELNLVLGDLSYGDAAQEQAWCDLVLAQVGAGFPFELVAGNHESNGQNGHINDFGACLPNQLPGLVGTYGRQWYVDYPRSSPLVRFVMISPGLTFPDGQWSYAAGTDHYLWTAAAIDGARTARIPWVVVGMHRPCVSVGLYDCAGIADLANLLLGKRVDLVLTGHEHFYQRTHQLRAGADTGCPTLTTGSANTACLAATGNLLPAGAGTVFVTAGTGGKELRDVNPADPEAGYFSAWSGANASPSYGFLDVSADASNLIGRFVAVTGSYTDSFKLTRDPIPTPSGSDSTTGTPSTPPSETPSTSISTSSPPPADTSTPTTSTPATSTTSSTPTPSTGAPPGTLAADSFTRTVTQGLGTADTGGPWSVSGNSSTSVVGGQAQLVMPLNGGQLITLPGAGTAASTDLAVSYGLDRPPTGAGAYLRLLGRRTTAGDYRAKLRVRPGGSVWMSVERADAANRETTLRAELQAPGLVFVTGDRLRTRVQVFGGSPTTVRARVWKVGTPEPGTWLVSVTDSTTGLQTAGGFGLRTYLAVNATNAPVTALLDDLVVSSPATG